MNSSSHISPDAEQLAAKAKAGCSASFARLVDIFVPRLLRYLRARLRGDHHAAEDVVQEALIKAHRNLQRYDTSRRFSPWLFTIASRLACSYLRKNIPQTADSFSHRLVDSNPGPQEHTQQRERRRCIWDRASQVLSATQFDALWLRYGEEKSIADVAAELDKSESNVKVILHRARKQMLASLSSSEGYRHEL